jgi:hypothetical protein
LSVPAPCLRQARLRGRHYSGCGRWRYPSARALWIVRIRPVSSGMGPRQAAPLRRLSPPCAPVGSFGSRAVPGRSPSR